MSLGEKRMYTRGILHNSPETYIDCIAPASRHNIPVLSLGTDNTGSVLGSTPGADFICSQFLD